MNLDEASNRSLSLWRLVNFDFPVDFLSIVYCEFVFIFDVESIIRYKRGSRPAALIAAIMQNDLSWWSSRLCLPTEQAKF